MLVPSIALCSWVGFVHWTEPSDSGPTTPLPNKKLLLFILDRLQKKDTYGVFTEPVDPEELPDYHDIIKHPMDFSTIRKKLDKGAYSNLEQFEVGYRICLGCLCFLLFGFFFNKIACACLVITTTKLLNLCSEMLWLT